MRTRESDPVQPAEVAKVHFQIDVHAPPHAVPEFVRLKVFIKRLGRRLGLKVDEIRQTGVTTTTSKRGKP